ncbi:MAG TPA: LCP family protein [Ktedonobacteraceae bacterium]|nr:LCP family protein [Ktedonobacteraceae bacterium]
MKRQFVFMSPSQGQQNIHQEQGQPVTDAMQLPQQIQAVKSGAQPQRGTKPLGGPQFRLGSKGQFSQAGLLLRPDVQADNLFDKPTSIQQVVNKNQVPNPSASMINMDPFQQPSRRDPRTEPGFRLDRPHPPQGFMPDKVSPFQSGIMAPPMQMPPPQPMNRGQAGMNMPSQAGMHMGQPMTALPMSAPPMQISPASGALNPAWQQPRSGALPPNGSLARVPFKKRPRRIPVWARVAICAMLVLIVGVGTAYGYYYVNFAGSVNKIIGKDVKRVDGDSVANTNTGSFGSGRRVNILLLGSDTDQKTLKDNHGALAQTDMVVTIDPATHYVGMLSFPRDAWVPVPLNGTNNNKKLDQAFLLGSNGLLTNTNDGAALAMATIHQDFGIPINYYAWVGLDGFMKVIDVLNGVDVDVTHPIVDDSYPDDTDPNVKDKYALKRLYLAPGPQHLNGVSALEYVRTRHADLVGDFGRTARQQQVLTQLKSKLNNPDIFGKLKDISDALAGHVTTSMQYSDILGMMDFARSLDTKKIDRVSLGGPPYSSPDQHQIEGQSVVLMNCAPTMAKIAQMFALNNQTPCNVGTADNGTTASTGNYKNTSPLAASPSPLSDQGLYSTPSDSLQTVDAMANMGPDSVNAQGDKQLYGIRSLLDLMFLTVFESPDALKA